jgi:lysophospholipase L1-like esterase
VQNSTPDSQVTAVDLYTGILPSDLSDGVHLNMSGSQKVADRFYMPLAPLLKP